MSRIHLDTHVVAWLLAGEIRRIPASLRRTLEARDLAVSPAVLLELQLLHEIGRLAVPGEDAFATLHREIGLERAPGDFSAVVSRSLAIGWARDPFDRLIVGHAAEDGAPLATKDRSIRRHYRDAVWGP